MANKWAFKYEPGNDTGQFENSDYMFNAMDNLSAPASELEKHRQVVSYYLTGIGGSVVCCLGTVANVLSIAVLTRRSMRSSTYMYLTALAVCDCLALILTLSIIINDTKPPESSEQTDHFHAILFPVVHPLAVVFQVTSIWLTLAFTVDRYIMICHPFKAEWMCRRSRARKVIISLYVAGMIFNIPRFLEYTTILDTIPLANSSEVITIYGIRPTALGNSELFREIIHSWTYLLFICSIPFFTLVILNAFLIRAVHLSRLKGKEINSREKHRNDTTIMLIGVIVIFLICQGPALVSRMIYAFKPTLSSATKPGITLNEVGNFFVLLNSAINIVPYYLFGRKFRSEFWRIFCSCFFDKDELRRITRSYSLSVDHRRMSQYNVVEMNSVTQSSYNPCNSVISGHSTRNSPALNNKYVDKIHRPCSNGISTSLVSDTTNSVVVPLVHDTYRSVSSHRLPSRDSSKESFKKFSSSFCSESEPLSRMNPTAHVQYMAVASGPCINSSEWSAV